MSDTEHRPSLPHSHPHRPPHRATTRNWSICRSVRGLSGSQTFISIFCWFRLSDSPEERARRQQGEKAGVVEPQQEVKAGC